MSNIMEFTLNDFCIQTTSREYKTVNPRVLSHLIKKHMGEEISPIEIAKSLQSQEEWVKTVKQLRSKDIFDEQIS